MKIAVRFNGFYQDQNIQESLPLYYYERGKNTECITLKKNEVKDLDKKFFDLISKTLINNSVVSVTSVDLTAILKKIGTGKFTVGGDGTAPDVTVTHNLGTTLYAVILTDEVNYEVVEKTANSFKIRRKITNPAQSSNASVDYAVLV